MHGVTELFRETRADDKQWRTHWPQKRSHRAIHLLQPNDIIIIGEITNDALLQVEEHAC